MIRLRWSTAARAHARNYFCTSSESFPRTPRLRAFLTHTHTYTDPHDWYRYVSKPSFLRVLFYGSFFPPFLLNSSRVGLLSRRSHSVSWELAIVNQFLNCSVETAHPNYILATVRCSGPFDFLFNNGFLNGVSEYRGSLCETKMDFHQENSRHCFKSHLLGIVRLRVCLQN